MASAEQRRYTLPKAERLSHREAIQYVFQHGTSLKVGVLTFFYVWDYREARDTHKVHVGFTAPKRSFKRAVDRNTLKRRMREAYRLQKFILLDAMPADKPLLLFISYRYRQIMPSQRIHGSMRKGLQMICKAIGEAPTQEQEG